MERADANPPPATAEETTVSASSAVTVTASAPTVTSTPSIIPTRDSSIEVRAQPGHGVDAEDRKAEHLVVALVGHVVDASRQLEPRQMPGSPEDAPGPPHVDAIVAGIAAREIGFELARHHVGLDEQPKPLVRGHGRPDVPGVARYPAELLAGFQVCGVEVRVVHVTGEPRQRVDGRVGLEALNAGLADVGRDEEARGRVEGDLDQFGEVRVEVRSAEPHTVLPELLVNPDFPAHALLRLEVGVAEARKEEIV